MLLKYKQYDYFYLIYVFRNCFFFLTKRVFFFPLVTQAVSSTSTRVSVHRCTLQDWRIAPFYLKHLSGCRHHNESDGVRTLSSNRGNKTGLLSFLPSVIYKGKYKQIAQILITLDIHAISCNRIRDRTIRRIWDRKRNSSTSYWAIDTQIASLLYRIIYVLYKCFLQFHSLETEISFQKSRKKMWRHRHLLSDFFQKLIDINLVELILHIKFHEILSISFLSFLD